MIRNKLIGLVAVENGARSGCSSDGGDKQIRCRKDDSGSVRVSAKANRSDCPRSWERAPSHNNSSNSGGRRLARGGDSTHLEEGGRIL